MNLPLALMTQGAYTGTMSNEMVSRSKCCVLCGASDAITQPAAPLRIGGLPGSERIDTGAKWSDVCIPCLRANNRVLDAEFRANASPAEYRWAMRHGR